MDDEVPVIKGLLLVSLIIGGGAFLLLGPLRPKPKKAATGMAVLIGAKKHFKRCKGNAQCEYEILEIYQNCFRTHDEAGKRERCVNQGLKSIKGF